ncbi:hypothetical protein D1N62_20245, partial [Clostridioides difficile]
LYHFVFQRQTERNETVQEARMGRYIDINKTQYIVIYIKMRERSQCLYISDRKPIKLVWSKIKLLMLF